MEELPNQQGILTLREDNQMKGLEDKIKVMWKTIEELKMKVMEEKELLKKEKSENEKMMEEQMKLRKQLSMFHLPHCPAYNTPPCPVHSFNPQAAITPTESWLDTYVADQKDGFVGKHGTANGDNAEKQSFEELLHSLNPQPELSLEDLFEECRQSSAAAPCGTKDQTSDFTLLMSEQWQSRKAAGKTRPQESKHQNNLVFDQVETTPFGFEHGEPQLSNPSHIYPNL